MYQFKSANLHTSSRVKLSISSSELSIIDYDQFSTFMIKYEHAEQGVSPSNLKTASAVDFLTCGSRKRGGLGIDF